MQAKVNVQGEPQNFHGVGNEFLRIGQEVLTNALRHAHASQFDVLLVYESREIA